MMMNGQNKKIRLGVLNMTICFDKNYNRCKPSLSLDPNLQKTQQLPTFIPRYGSHRHRNSLQKKETNTSPYLTYRHSQNQSIRYFREQEEVVRSSYQKIAGFSLINNTIQLEITDKFQQEDDHLYTPNSFVPDNHLKMVKNKKNLRNTMEQQHERIKTYDQLKFNLKTNPENNLKSIFTVRAAKTSQRTREKSSISPNRPYKEEEKIMKLPQTQRLCRNPSSNKEGEIKRIRPWSTSKNWETKLSMYESQILNDAVKNQL